MRLVFNKLEREMYLVLRTALAFVVLLWLASCSSGGSSGGKSSSSTGASSASSSSSTSSSGASSSSSSGSSSGSSGSSSSSSSGMATPPDLNPDVLVLTPKTDADFGLWVIFGPVEVQGINVPIDITFDGGEYSLDGASFTHQPGEVTNGQELVVRMMSASTSFTKTVAELRLGQQVYEMSVTTKVDTTAPTGTITFPAGNASTEKDSISVSAIASDDDIVESVELNGISASFDSATNTWSAQVPLSPGLNELVMTITDAAGNVASKADSTWLDNQPPLDGPDGIAIDGKKDIAYISDDTFERIYAVDLSTGLRTIVTGGDKGAGPQIRSPGKIATSGDGALLYISDALDDRIYRVSIANGKRDVISDSEKGNGPVFVLPGALLLSEDEKTLYVSDGANDRVLAVDVATGNRKLVSGGGVGTGPALHDPQGMAWAPQGDGFYLVNEDAIFFVELLSGNRSVVSSGSVGVGPEFREPRSVVLAPSEKQLIVAGWYEIFSVNIASGDRTVIADDATGDGLVIGLYIDVAVDRLGRVLAVDASHSAITAINTQTGTRSILSGKFGSFGNGWKLPVALDYSDKENALIVADPYLEQVIKVSFESHSSSVIVESAPTDAPEKVNFSYLALDESNNKVYVGQNLYSKIVEFDLNNGTSNVIFDEKLSMEYLGIISSMASDGENSKLYYTARDAASIYEVELPSGERKAVSSPDVGSGFELDRPVDLVADPAKNRLLAAHDRDAALVFINLSSGERQVVTSDYLSVGSGPIISNIHQFDADLSIEKAWCVTFTSDEIFEIDLVNGNRTLISSGNINGGPKVDYSDDVVYSRKLHSLFVATPNEAYIVQVNVRTGDRVLFFPYRYSN